MERQAYCGEMNASKERLRMGILLSHSALQIEGKSPISTFLYHTPLGYAIGRRMQAEARTFCNLKKSIIAVDAMQQPCVLCRYTGKEADPYNEKF